jgi:ketosteroid isomerase-like protein
MTRDQVQTWLDDYVSAWRSGDAEAIGRLFTDEAKYSYRPWDSEEHTVIGRVAIVESWLTDRSEPVDWVAEYRPYAVEGDRAVAVGTTLYTEENRRYHNAFLLRFDESGRCAEFREFFVREKL